MTDRYSCFAELAAKEQEDVDYRVAIKRRNSTIAIIAPHGGKIEPMTTRLARLIAGADFNFYSFIGTAERGRNRELHITSHNFDEPKCVKLISNCDVVVAIHGRRDEGDPFAIYLGGLDRELMTRAAKALADAGIATKIGGHEFPARHATNICNRGQRRMGLQLELPRTLRDRFCAETEYWDRFVRSIRLSIDRHRDSLA